MSRQAMNAAQIFGGDVGIDGLRDHSAACEGRKGARQEEAASSSAAANGFDPSK